MKQLWNLLLVKEQEERSVSQEQVQIKSTCLLFLLPKFIHNSDSSLNGVSEN